MIYRGESIRVMHPIFQLGEDGSTPISPLSAKNLLIEDIDIDRAKQLNRKWHSRLPRFGTGFIKDQPYLCYAATHRGIIYAVAIWSNPIARFLPQQDWLELRRLATAPDAPKNTCTRMIRIMEIIIKRQIPWISNLISYQDIEVHKGSIYKASGWKETIITHGSEWNNTSRSRPKAQSTANKKRWEKTIIPTSKPPQKHHKESQDIYKDQLSIFDIFS